MTRTTKTDRAVLLVRTKVTNLNFGDQASNSLVQCQKKPNVRISYFRDSPVHTCVAGLVRRDNEKNQHTKVVTNNKRCELTIMAMSDICSFGAIFPDDDRTGGRWETRQRRRMWRTLDRVNECVAKQIKHNVPNKIQLFLNLIIIVMTALLCVATRRFIFFFV